VKIYFKKINIYRYFRDHIPYIDRGSISIWGWSYGGYLTTMALIQEYNDTVFKCGVAVAPVSDLMFYGLS
jgi:dipeptidyl-peptidase-4